MANFSLFQEELYLVSKQQKAVSSTRFRISNVDARGTAGFDTATGEIS